MGVIAKYKFDSSLCADFIPEFNSEFTGYTTSDVNNGDNTITRTISHDTLKPTLIRFGSSEPSGNGDYTKQQSLLEIIELNIDNSVTNMQLMFYRCSNLTSINLSNFDTSNVNNMFGAFSECSSLTSLDVSNFNTSSVTNMNNTFNNCSSLTSLDVSNFDTSNVTNMSYMFQNCSKLISLDLSNFNTSQVQYMDSILRNCSSLITLDVSNFDTSKVTNMGGMFNSCSSLTSIDLSNFNTSNVNNMGNMFANCRALTSLGLLYSTSTTINTLVPLLGTSTARNIYYTDAPLDELTVQDNITYKEYKITKATLPYTLNKLPNGVADYIDVVNKVHVQRVGVRGYQETDATDNTVITDTTNTLYELKTPIYTPLTNEEIAQLPLSAYKDGYINLSSDQLTPSFEFRMRASNRYQVDMLETGYYYLNAPVGNVKLGTANVDVQQMPCIVKVDNVDTGNSGYRLGFGNGFCEDVKLTVDGYYLNIYSGELLVNSSRATSDYVYIDYYDDLCVEDLGNREYFDMVFYDEDKRYISYVSWDMVKNYGRFKAPRNAKYFRVSIVHKGNKVIRVFAPITLAKLPSHRIPTSFTQGMKCGTDFGYWEGIKVATGKQLYVNETNQLNFNTIELNRIEYNNTIVEDEFDIATGKLTKRIGKYTIDGNSNITTYSYTNDTALYKAYVINDIPNLKKYSHVIGFIFNKGSKVPQNAIDEECWQTFTPRALYFRFRKDRYSQYGTGADGVKAYFNANPTTIYYELEVPEISYVNLPSNQVKTVANSTLLQSWRNGIIYLNPQVKPSHLTYPVPSLVGNRTYTVVHNRKNITGSTKPIELNLGGTVVQLNDASSKTLVKTPSTLAHSNLIFIGGESTVDHIMVLDGDWTNKPIEYFENMKGHDTDAIITIIGDGKIDDVAEQYLW